MARGQGLFEDALAGAETPAASKATEDTEADGGDKLSATVAGVHLELGGYARGVLYLGKTPEEQAAEVKAGYGEAALALRARKGKWGAAFAEGRLRAGWLDGEAAAEPDLREVYVDLYLGPVDLRFGHQIVAWGRADAVNPTNNLTPVDLRVRSPAEDDLRRANLALRGNLNLEPVRWELVWVPMFAPSHFPRFDLNSPFPGIALTLAEPDYPGAALSWGLGATRLHLLLPSVEASVSYLVGSGTFPGVALQRADLGPPAAVTVGFSAYRHQVVGADFATSLLGFGLRGEVAWKSPFGVAEGEHVPRPEVQYVAGLDRELFGQLFVILQYSGKTVLEWGETPGAARAPTDDSFTGMARGEVARANRLVHGQTERVQHQVTARLEWRLLHETLSFEALGVYNISTEELLVRPRVSYDLADALRASIGGELVLGPEGTLYGLVEQSHSAGYVELRAAF